MNQITTINSNLAISEEDAIRVLGNSLYPGARPESIALVLSWCRATGRDPMKKPIHIVPMWVKDAITGNGSMQDVLMPGIGTYRTDAANSGQYAGKTEPEFGPDMTETLGNVSVSFPLWCKVTVQRLVAGQVRDFTAKEFWKENYATAKKDTDAPNYMWKKRPYGQLAKCAESQALRMAFPDETGNTNTAEEMEGKTFDGVTIDATPTQRSNNFAMPTQEMPTLAPAKTPPTALDSISAKLAKCLTAVDVLTVGEAWGAHKAKALEAGKPVTDLIAEACQAMISKKYNSLIDAGEPMQEAAE